MHIPSPQADWCFQFTVEMYIVCFYCHDVTESCRVLHPTLEVIRRLPSRRLLKIADEPTQLSRHRHVGADELTKTCKFQKFVGVDVISMLLSQYLPIFRMQMSRQYIKTLEFEDAVGCNDPFQCHRQISKPATFRREGVVKLLKQLPPFPAMAQVLTPQKFGNVDEPADIFNHTNRHFWEAMIPGLTAWGMVVCTGSNLLVRATALMVNVFASPSSLLLRFRCSPSSLLLLLCFPPLSGWHDSSHAPGYVYAHELNILDLQSSDAIPSFSLSFSCRPPLLSSCLPPPIAFSLSPLLYVLHMLQKIFSFGAYSKECSA